MAKNAWIRQSMLPHENKAFESAMLIEQGMLDLICRFI